MNECSCCAVRSGPRPNCIPKDARLQPAGSHMLNQGPIFTWQLHPSTNSSRTTINAFETRYRRTCGDIAALTEHDNSALETQ